MTELQKLFIDELKIRYGLLPEDIGGAEEYEFNSMEDVEDELIFLEAKYDLKDIRKTFYQ